ncbi:metal ABC transporter permease [bacterium]|nr:metal ABC transporter permease [bacterium]
MFTYPNCAQKRLLRVATVAVVIGLFGAFVVDVPVGPSIVVCATAIFLVLTLARGGKV